jgi:hypothetical protein
MRTFVRPRREGDRQEFHGPEEVVRLEEVDGKVYARADRDTTCRALARKGFVEVEEVASPSAADEEPETAPDATETAPASAPDAEPEKPKRGRGRAR